MEPIDSVTVKKILQIKGEARGIVFKTDLDYIRGQKGPDGFKSLVEEIKKTGYLPEYDQIRTLDFYPIGLRALSLLLIRQVFNLSDQEVKEIGVSAPKLSLIIKLFTKYFLSITTTASQAPTMWEKHYRAGRLIVDEINEKEKRIVLHLEDLDLHPVFCKYLEGYFLTVVRMVVGSTTVSSEIQCSFRGDRDHKYLITWQ